MAMEKDVEPGAMRSSLERLKALDTLPDLPTQLREAKELCNHSARAEMISKWLVAKLKSEAKAQGSPETWDTLSSAFRLLSPPKVATLLSSQDLLGICKSALQDHTNGEWTALFLALVRILNFLLETAAGPEGTPLKAVLSVSALQAASFLDVWIDSALNLVGIALFENEMGHGMLQPVFEIWNVRKRSADENETFAKHCFLSVSRLLPLINHYEATHKLKRRRDGNESAQPNYKQLLESMLAKHVFVPARTAFFKAREATETKGRRQIGSQDPEFVLRSMFQPLHNDDLNNTGLDDGQLAVLTDLFDVAVRCVPRVTPKQRIKEKLWLDAVFKAICECMGTLKSDGVAVRDALRGILSIAKGKEVVLSKDVLDDLIKRHSGLTSEGSIDWKLIQLVLQIDSDVFSDETMAAILLTEVTNATVDLPYSTTREPKPYPPGSIDTGKEFTDFLREQVIVPVMKAFADRRKLGSFVDMWATQYSDNQQSKHAHIWVDLANDFVPLLEDFLPHDQVLALFDRYYAPIKSAAEDQARHDSSVPRSRLKSSIIILHAVLSGVLSEPLSDAIHERCGELFATMFDCEYDYSTPTSTLTAFPMQPESWNLLMKALELWFPSWAIAQSNSEVVGEFGAKIIKSRSYNIAQFHLQDSGLNTTRAARMFIFSVCAHLHKYDQATVHEMNDEQKPRRSCLEPMYESLDGGFPDESTWPILLQFPNLIADLGGDETINLIEDCIRSRSQSGTEVFQALATYTLQHADNKKIDDLMRIVVLYLSHQKQPEYGSDNEDRDEVVEWLCEQYEIVTLKVIAGLSAESISRPHREQILNAVCAKQQAEKHPEASENPEAQTWRIVVLTSLTKLPNATCNLAVDLDELWRLTRSVIDYPDQNIVPMVEELTIQLSTNLLATQDQERSRSMLIGFADKIKAFLEEISTNGRIDPWFDVDLVVNMAVLVRLEAGSKEELKSSFSYRNPETINPFIAVCLNDITLHAKEAKDRYNAHDSGAQERPLSTDAQLALKVLLAMPETILHLATTDTELWHEPSVELIESSLIALENKDNHDRNEKQTSAIQDVFVTGFRIVCKVSTAVYRAGYTTLARRFINLHLTAVQRDSFITAFGLYVQKMQGQQYVELLDDLLNSMRAQYDATTMPILPLVEVCATNLDRAKLESIESPFPRLLSTLLSLCEQTRSIIVRKHAMKCVVTTLKGNAALANQYCIEMTLATMTRFLKDASKAQRVYLEMCQILSILLLQYRSRLHGRFHLVTEVFQALLSALFEPIASNSSTVKQEKGLTTKQAQAVAKLLTLFCEPPQFNRSSKTSGLVDEARKEQAHVGKSVQYILHHYCSQILNGTLGPGMKEALTPGLWSIIEAMEMGEAEGVKSLSAAMNNSERAVLRGVYDDWRRFGKWRGA